MRKFTRIVVTVVTLAWFAAPTLAESAGWSHSEDPMPRVRTSDSTILTLMTSAYRQSATFRRVHDMIAATDGIVYVESGLCGRGVRACLMMSVTVAGPSRILRIHVEPKKDACERMASIGHELWHALEVLRQSSVTTAGGLYFFYEREGHRLRGPHTARETVGALRIGYEVLAELRNAAKDAGYSCSSK
jgi:hypothetical protein